MEKMNTAQNTATDSIAASFAADVQQARNLRITDKTTLGELLEILGLEAGQKRKGNTPTRAKLIASAEPIVKMCDITLYNSGFALYENGIGRHYVVWLPYCVNFTYYFNKLRDTEKEYLRETDKVPSEKLMTSKWTSIVAFFGEERITQNMFYGFGNADTSTKGGTDEDEEFKPEPEDEDMEGRNFVWYDETLGVDPLDAVIRRENREEMLAAMTYKQREVFVLYHKYGWTQQKIADVIGISRDSVNDRLECTYRNAKKVIQNAW
ncbi:MAG: sigma-70 family RNA polymerase sigma factor [Ruminococcus sp.]|nr:sigma-70 family RNA polymerase sigma factor [Ruminococcus sp.]